MKLRNIIWVLIIVISCKEEDSNVLKNELIETDKSFSLRAKEKGIADAFVYYADEKVIKPEAGKQPIFGKYALMQSYDDNPPTYTLTWEPLRAEASGNLGYTFGAYTVVTKNSSGNDTTLYGNYISIWKRKKDGSWRYVIDTGNETPGPVKLQ